MRELVAQYLSKSISRRRFVSRLVSTGVSLAAAQSVLQSLTSLAQGQDRGGQVSPEGVTLFEGTGGEAFAEQLIASGVKYLFGNSSSGDAPFYNALVDRPQLNYILTPHEGPGAAMAAGYIKASPPCPCKKGHPFRGNLTPSVLTLEGKPYLIDAQVRRTGVGWDESPWVPTLDFA